jgi:flagellar hook-associated protein 1 FlgK
MSINSLLSTARLALSAQQIAIETGAHNIANADVEGYSRQRADLAANTPLNTQWGTLGTGVIVQNISRLRDSLLDVSYRTQSANSGGFDMRSDLLTQVSGVFNEPSDTGFASTLDQFWSAWSDLANNPDDVAAKSVVQQRGAQVATTLNNYSQGLDAIAGTSREQVGNLVSDLNNFSKQIADLNRQIGAAESGGNTASDLRDTRDQLIDQMSAIAPVSVVEHSNGADTVYVGGATVVDGTAAQQFSLQQNGAQTVLALNGQTIPVSNSDGKVGALLGVLNTDIPAAKSQLDQIAQQLVTTVNTIHRTGWTQAGDALGGANWDTSAPPTGSNVDFFDPTGTTAATISLSANVATNASYIAAGNVQGGTGNNTVALQLSQLRDDTSTMLQSGSTTQTASFGDYYRDIVTKLGIATDDANTSASVYDTLVQQADTRRQSVSGVSTDDELIELTKHQQSYAAAAKVVTTADQMAQSLLDMIR